MRGESIKAEWLKAMEKSVAKAAPALAAPIAEVAQTCGDPLEWLPHYIPPFARPQSATAATATAAGKTPAFDALNAFFDDASPARALLLLGEAGFGKSTLLGLLRLSQALGHWAPGLACRLIPLSSGADAAIAAIPDPASTILLLDGLDEDPLAAPDPVARARAILEATQAFHRVVLTCHNRFFLRELAGGKTLAGTPFATLLLMGFDDPMIETYLESRYPQRWLRPKASRFSREVARDTLHRLRLLRFCPFLLARIEDLAELEHEQIDEYTALEAICLRWLLAESERLNAIGVPHAAVDSLYALVKRVAVYAAEEAAYAMPRAALAAWSSQAPGRPAIEQLSLAGSSILRLARTGAGEPAYRLAHPSLHGFIVAQNVLDESSPEEIVVPPYATERIVDYIVKGRQAEDEHRHKRLVLRNLKLATFGFDQANLRGAVIEGADLRRASFKNANLSGVEFRDCRLEGADFGQAITTGASLDRLAPGLPFRLALDADTSLELLWVNPGEFTIGEDRAQGHIVIPHGFWLGRYPVTQEQYRAVAKNNPSAAPRIGENAPVEQVSWNDAQLFCQKLAQLLPEAQRGAFHFRLPKETEWEYACRAGTTTAFSFGDSADEISRFGWSSRNSSGQPQPVGQKLPNPWGFHDMHGNVWEWCHDWSGDFLAGVISDLKGPSERSDRVVRGGSCSNGPYSCRSANRNWHPPTARFSNLGFRVALLREPPSPLDAKKSFGL